MRLGKNNFILLNIPVFLDIFPNNLLVWPFQFKCLSSVMPRKLNWSTDSISVSANFNRGITTFFWGILNTINYVFDALSDSLLTISHSLILDSSLLILIRVFVIFKAIYFQSNLLSWKDWEDLDRRNKSKGRCGKHKWENKSKGRCGKHKWENKSKGGCGKHKWENKSKGRCGKHKWENKSKGRCGKHKWENKRRETDMVYEWPWLLRRLTSKHCS